MQNTLQDAQEQDFLDLTRWAQDTISRIRMNYATQKVWPLGSPGPYKGYAQKNSERKSKGQGGSTGDSYRRIYAKVYSAANGDTERISFFFNYYLYFVDMGVGRGRKWEFVHGNAKYDQLYRAWKNEGDRQQRPFLTMEFRHQIKRLSSLLEYYYADKVRIDVVAALTGERTLNSV